jgi:hypothetical protein
MRRGVCNTALGPALLLAAALGWPGAAAASPTSRAITAVDCALTGSRVSVVQGPVGAGHDNVIIEVKNSLFEPCVLPIYPTVELFDQVTGSFLFPVASPQGPLDIDSALTPSPLLLPPGFAASALLGGTDIPLDDAQTCPTFDYSVRLPNSSQAAHFNGPLADCSGFILGPFTLGFNGASPTGEVVGRAPSCTPRRSTAGAYDSVQVEAWHGRGLANLVQTYLGSTRSSKLYQMVLSPGRYRLTSGRAWVRRVTVRAGEVENIGQFGACESRPSPTTLRTVPPKGLTTGPTTTTPKPGGTETSVTAASGGGEITEGTATAPCANDQLDVTALRYGAASGAVSEVIAFTDISSEPCTLTGYPGVAALDSQGLQVEQARRQLNSMMGGQYEGTRPQIVPLEPGGLATATVQGSDMPVGAATACPSYFPSLLVTAPDDTDSVTLTSVGMQGSGYGERGFPGCSPLIVTPVVPGVTGSPAA